MSNTQSPTPYALHPAVHPCRQTPAPKRRADYDDDLLVALLAEGRISYRRIAEQVGISHTQVSRIARGLSRRDLYDRMCTLVEDANRRTRRLAAGYLTAIVARHVKLAIEGTGEPARRSREFLIRIFLNMPDPAGRYVGRPGSGAASVCRADLDLIAAVRGGPGAPALRDLPRRSRRRLRTLVAQDGADTPIRGTAGRGTQNDDTQNDDTPIDGIPIPHLPIDRDAAGEALARNAEDLAETGELHRAMREYGKAIQMTPHHGPHYVARAGLHDLAGDPAAAVADLNQAVELAPDDPAAWRARALSHYAHGQYRTAMRDLSEAIRLQPDCPDNYFHRGRAILGLRGRPFHIAADDFRRALDCTPDWPGCEHAALWRHVARGRAGCDGREELARFRHERLTARGTWLVPAVRLYLGEITPEECLSASADEDPQIHAHQACNAHLHVGEFYLLGGDKAKAKEHFEESIAIGPVRAAQCARRAARVAAAACPGDPDEADRLARSAAMSEYYAAKAELDFLAKAAALRQKRQSWGYTDERLAELDARPECRIEDDVGL